MTAQPDTEPRHTRRVDPRTLVTRDNVRAIIDPDPELVESIRVHGVLQPPLVYADGPDLVLIAGHRRAAAAIAAGLDRIDVVVGQPMDQAQRVAAQVSENTNRSGLRVVEVASAVDQLALLGMPVGQIAKAAGLRAAQVEAARRVAAAGRETKEAVSEAPELTLDQAAALTEWEDVPGAVSDLLAAAADGPVRFAHEQARLAEEREERAEVEEAIAGWTAKGYRAFRHDQRDEVPDAAEPVYGFAGADGKRLGNYYGASEAHASCPGRAVVLGRWDPETVNELCLDPQANGHTNPAPSGGPGKPTVSAEQAKEERKRVIGNNKLWRAATGVRHDHIKAFIRAGKFPPALIADLHGHLLAHPDHLADQRGLLFVTVTNFPGSGMGDSGKGRGLARRPAADAPHNRIAGLLLAATADAAEKSLDSTTWRSSNRGAAAWLDLLVAHTGYQLADIEVTAMKATTPTWKPPQAEAAAKSTTRTTAAATTAGATPPAAPARPRAARGRTAK